MKQTLAIVALVLLVSSASLAGAPNVETREIAARVAAQGGWAEFDDQGRIIAVSLGNTFATDTDLEPIASLQDLRKLDLSLTYVTDRGIEILKGLKNLEELDLFAAEFITDAAFSYLRGHPSLKRLNLRATEVTDICLLYIAEMPALKHLDISFTLISDVGLDSVSSLTQLEELITGGNKITNVGYHTLRLLPNLRTLSLKGIQRRDAGLCWAAAVGEVELDTIASLTSLEELNLGWGIGLGPARPGGETDSEAQCRIEGGIRITNSGLRKLRTLEKLNSIEMSGSEITSAGLADVLPAWKNLRQLSLWNVEGLDDSIAGPLAELEHLEILDLSRTPLTDEGLKQLAKSRSLRRLFVSRTEITEAGVEAFRQMNPGCWISWDGYARGGE